MKKSIFLFLPVLFLFPVSFYAQHPGSSLPLISNVDPQPLLAQAIRLDEALSFLGSALSAEDTKRLKAFRNQAPGKEVTALIQEILDPQDFEAFVPRFLMLVAAVDEARPLRRNLRQRLPVRPSP